MYHWLIFATLVANVPPATPPPPATYISDRLSVALHGANAPDAPIVKQVLGGAPIKILSREGALLKIRTEDGSVGWVEHELVTTDTPIHLQYLELTDRFAKAQETIKSLQDTSGISPAAGTGNESKIVTELRAEIKNTLEHAVALEKHIRDNSSQVLEAIARVRALEEENATLRNEVAAKPAAALTTATRDAGNFFPAGTAPVTPKFSVSLPWFVASLSVVLALGGGATWFIMNRRLRKKLSKFRAKL
ncbi:MAG: hypothetical protein HY273_08455 [Gammaproteobacteria bacterium]|nr:hypothetical protein [Gammaproteobacteria bacterium]